MKRCFQILNIFSVIFALTMNFLVGSQALGVLSIKQISDTYATLLTPATYAFSIWFVIYILLIVLAVYQARDLKKPSSGNDLPQKLGLWFVLANICNGLWTYIFVSDLIGLSAAVLSLLAASLYIVLFRFRIALNNPPVRTIAFIWWPLLIYTGWVTAALVVNYASWLASLGIIIPEIVAAAIVAVLAVFLLLLIRLRNMRELALASAWGIAAVGVKQADESSVVSGAAFLSAALLVLVSIIQGYRHRSDNALFISVTKFLTANIYPRLLLIKKAALFFVVLIIGISLCQALVRFTFVDRNFTLGIVALWFVTAYLTLPRLHKLLTKLYVPNYYIGRARTGEGLLSDPVNLAGIGTKKTAG